MTDEIKLDKKIFLNNQDNKGLIILNKLKQRSESRLKNLSIKTENLNDVENKVNSDRIYITENADDLNTKSETKKLEIISVVEQLKNNSNKNNEIYNTANNNNKKHLQNNCPEKQNNDFDNDIKKKKKKNCLFRFFRCFD